MSGVQGEDSEHAQATGMSLDSLARLKDISFLSRLSLRELETVAACGTPLRLPVDCLVDEQISQGSSMYLLLSGRVRFWVDDVDMRDITLGYASAPNFFGELCFLSPGRRSTNVTTCTEVDLLEIESTQIHTLAALCPDLIRVLTAEVVDRCRGNVETLQNTVFRTAKERVLNTLLTITHESHSDDKNQSRRRQLGLGSDTCVVQGYTHGDLASMAFTTRETVTRTLAELESEGVIESRATGWMCIRPAMIRSRLGSGTSNSSKPARGRASTKGAVS